MSITKESLVMDLIAFHPMVKDVCQKWWKHGALLIDELPSPMSFTTFQNYNNKPFTLSSYSFMGFPFWSS
jgi:hypothetical protein